jgi:hypothetical protein
MGLNGIDPACAFPSAQVQTALRRGRQPKTEISDYQRFCSELEAYFGRRGAASSFGFCHRVKVDRQGGFTLLLKGEAVPVFSLDLYDRFAGREVFVSAELRRGVRIITISAENSADCGSYFTLRVYDPQVNRVCYRRKAEPADSVTYVLTVGPDNETNLLGHRVVFNFAWRPGDIVLGQVAGGELQQVLNRARGETYPITKVTLPGRPTTLLVGDPITGKMLAKVDGILEKELSVHFNRKNGTYYFSLGGKDYNLTAADFLDIPNPLKAKITVTLDQGQPGAITIMQGRTRRRIKYVVVRDEKGVTSNVSPRNPYHCPKGVTKKGEGTHIVEGFFGRLASEVNGAGTRVYFEEVDFFGARERIRRVVPNGEGEFVPGRYSFIVYKGGICFRQNGAEPTVTCRNFLKLRAYCLAEWPAQPVGTDGFYHGLLAVSPERDVAQERSWRRAFFSRLERGDFLSWRTPLVPSVSDYREAAAFVFVLGYILAGKAFLPERTVEMVAQRTLPLVAALGEEVFSQVAAWLFLFPDTRDALFLVLPHLDIRDRQFGGTILGSFQRDPFLWDTIFKQLMG